MTEAVIIKKPETICSANQWTGFCMITVSVMKELKYLHDIKRILCREEINFISHLSFKSFKPCFSFKSFRLLNNCFAAYT